VDFRKEFSFSKIQLIQKSNLTLPPTSYYSEIILASKDYR